MNHQEKYTKLHNKPHLEPRMDTSARARFSDAVIGTLHTCVIMALSIICALWMAEDVFPEITLPAQYFGYVIAILLPLAILVGIVAECWRMLRLLWRYLIPVAYFSAMIYYGFRNVEELQEGIHYLSRPVLEAVNYYYKTNFVIHAGGMLYADSTLAFIVLCAAVFFLTEAMWCGKRLLLAGLPVIVLVGEMAVGKTPEVRSMVLLFVIVMLSEMGGWEDAAHPMEKKVRLGAMRRILSILVPVGVLAACLLIGGVALKEPAAQIAEYGVQVRQFQWDMEEQIEDWVNSLMAEAAREDWDDVTNRSPSYSDTEVLHATFSALPTENQYLRGYYGTYYEDGKWSSDEDGFDSLWESECPNKDIASYASYQRGKYDDPFITLKLDYVNLNTTTIYVPFTLDRSSLAASRQLTGEFRVTSSDTIDMIEYDFRDVESLTWYEGLITTTAFSDGETASWYTSYVEDNYLDVPDSLAEAANQIVDDIYDYNLDLLTADDSWLFSSTWIAEYYYAEILADPDYEWGNDVKYYVATMVADYMSDWTYSTELSGVPDGTDVVAYFMTESHTGYCVHYATAAVMVLRAFGVPARYATGYLCRVDNAVLNGDGEYEVSILDSDAHAWVEIYLEGIGWYPVEVTPGAGQESENTAPAVESESNAGRINSEAEESESAETESEQQESESHSGQGESESAESENTENGNRNPNGDNSSGNDSSGSSEGVSELVRILKFAAAILGILLLVAAVAFLIVFLCVVLPRRREQMQLDRIKRDIAAGKNRRAIYGIHRIIYRKLRKKTSVAVRRSTDNEYAGLLEKYFPQEEPFAWEKYVEIVQKCVFSKEEVTEEEARYCEGMLLQVTYKPK